MNLLSRGGRRRGEHRSRLKYGAYAPVQRCLLQASLEIVFVGFRARKPQLER